MDKHTKKKVVFFLLILVITSSACSFTLGNSDNSDGSDYSSNFEDVNDWEIFVAYEEEDYELESTSKGLHISLVNPSDIAYGYLDKVYSDITIESYVELVDGDADLTFELVCRSNNDGEYIFAFDLLGFYYVWIYNNELEDYIELEYGETDEINIESGKNAFSVNCIGDTFDFYINDALVTTIIDDTFSEGYVGFGVETYDENTAEVYLHYFNVYVK